MCLNGMQRQCKGKCNPGAKAKKTKERPFVLVAALDTTRVRLFAQTWINTLAPVREPLTAYEGRPSNREIAKIIEKSLIEGEYFGLILVGDETSVKEVTMGLSVRSQSAILVQVFYDFPNLSEAELVCALEARILANTPENDQFEIAEATDHVC